MYCGLVPEPIKAPGWLQFVAAVRNVAQLTPTYRYQFQNMRDWFFIVNNDYEAITPAFLHSLDLQVSGRLCRHLDSVAAHLTACAAQVQASNAPASRDLHRPAPQQKAQSCCLQLLCRSPACLKQVVCLQAAASARVVQLGLLTLGLRH